MLVFVAGVQSLLSIIFCTYSFFISNSSMAQKGISGNKDFGCDAIIVYGARKDEGGRCDDNLSTLEYWAETRVGGGSILTNMVNNNPIRVFRSSVLPNPYQAVEDNQIKKVSAPAVYRYDGLYQVTEVSFF